MQMTHARNGLTWLVMIGLVVLIVGASRIPPERPAPACRCPADCRILLARGHPEICEQFGIEVLTAPTCGLHDPPAE